MAENEESTPTNLTKDSLSVDEYQTSLMSFFNAGNAILAISLAKDVGILDILYKAKDGLTSQEIATRGNLKERYCREVLGALATSRSIEVDGTSQKYSIPAEHEDILRGLSIYARLAPANAHKYDAVKNCFSCNGPSGVRYSDFPVTIDIMRELREFHKDKLVDFILTPVDGLIQKLESGIEVGEFGCGYGALTINIAKRFSASSFTASDVVADVIEEIQTGIKEQNVTNVNFEVRDIYHLPESYNKKFDWIFVRDVIHDLPYADKALCQAYNSLKEGGALSLIEVGTVGSLADNVGNMDACTLYTLSTFNCLPESFQQPDSLALGAAWNTQTARGLIEAAGFSLEREYRGEKGGQDVHYVCRKVC